MKSISRYTICLFFFIMFINFSCIQKTGDMGMGHINEKDIIKVTDDLVAQYGEAQQERIDTGVRQVAQFWTKEDGSTEDFINFCMRSFISDPALLKKTLIRYENNMESMDGHMLEIMRDLREPMHLDMGPMLPVDYAYAQYSPFAHTNDDMFKTKVAFHALVNFKQHTLEERLKKGQHWSREEWAMTRLAEAYSARIPSVVEQALSKAYVLSDDYIANYNIFMHHVLDSKGNRLFRPGLKILAHWNLRDELKAQYADPDGLPKQELIQKVMESIIDQTIPEMAINNPAVDWNIETNQIQLSEIKDFNNIETQEQVTSDREPDTRYVRLLDIFKAEKMADPYYPVTPTKMDRRFQRNREIPEEKVEALFESILTSDEIKQTGKLISKRLGRNLKSFDIWYNGFKVQGTYQEQDLDRIVSKKYPTPTAFEKDIRRILLDLDFPRKTAKFLASKIEVDPARGSGHAWGAERKADKAHLRTRVPENGMNYKGYNIAVHELGHNCEQVISLNLMDNTLLSGVPNTAFTEAFAFVFQARDLELLDLKQNDSMTDHLKALDNLWATAEIAAVSLVDMKVWHWMYNNPNATPEALKGAVIQIAKDIWNQYYAPIFGIKDVTLLGIYSHMIHSGLYLPDYPLGHIIAFQIEEYLKGKTVGSEMVRMCKLGSITPDAWMQTAVGTPISTEPMLKASQKALAVLK